MAGIREGTTKSNTKKPLSHGKRSLPPPRPTVSDSMTPKEKFTADRLAKLQHHEVRTLRYNNFHLDKAFYEIDEQTPCNYSNEMQKICGFNNPMMPFLLQVMKDIKDGKIVLPTDAYKDETTNK